MSLSGISFISTDCNSLSSLKTKTKCQDSDINGYKLIKIVGQGTFGSVYEA